MNFFTYQPNILLPWKEFISIKQVYTNVFLFLAPFRLMNKKKYCLNIFFAEKWTRPLLQGTTGNYRLLLLQLLLRLLLFPMLLLAKLLLLSRMPVHRVLVLVCIIMHSAVILLMMRNSVQM